jgi:hypothetical protein
VFEYNAARGCSGTSKSQRRMGIHTATAIVIALAMACLAGCATGDTATLHHTQARVRKLADDLPLPPGFGKSGSYDQAAVPPHAVGGRAGQYSLRISGPPGMTPAEMVPMLDIWFTTHGFDRATGFSGSNGCQASVSGDSAVPGKRFAVFQWANADLAFAFQALPDDSDPKTELTIDYDFDSVNRSGIADVHPYTRGPYSC